MESNNSRISILIVGATGALGSLVTKYCLERSNLLVNILIRNPDKDPELVNKVEKAGGKVIIGDLLKPDSLKDCTKGMHTVVSVVNSLEDERIFKDAQITLIDDCVKNGVERFVPSEYGLNYFNLPEEELAKLLPFGRGKYYVHKYLKDKSLKTLTISIGAFLESVVSPPFKQLKYWGDLNYKYQLTSCDDCAKITAAAIARKDLTGDVVYVANRLNLKEVSEIYEQVRGIKITPERLGSLEELSKKFEEKMKEKDKNQEEVFFLGIQKILTDERSQFPENHLADFPEVKTTSFEEYLKQNPDAKIPE